MRQYILYLLSAALLMMSCARADREYGHYVSDRALAVTAVNMPLVASNAAVADTSAVIGLLLPDGAYGLLRDFSGSGCLDSQDVLFISGITGTYDSRDDLSLLIFKVVDPSRFVSYVSQRFSAIKVMTKGGIDYFDTPSGLMAIDGTIVIVSRLGDVDAMRSLLALMREDAAALPFASWKIKRLEARDATCSVISLDYLNVVYGDICEVPEHVRDGSLVIDTHISGSSLVTTGLIFDSRGDSVLAVDLQHPSDTVLRGVLSAVIR